jgi:hypothetical protein
MILGYVLFFLAGLGFGYAAPKSMLWFPFLFPIALAAIALVTAGVDLLAFIIGLVVTAIGILVGLMIRGRGEAAEQRS